jgi:hypothetical protein
MASTAVFDGLAAISVTSKFRVRDDLRIREKRRLLKMRLQVHSTQIALELCNPLQR